MKYFKSLDSLPIWHWDKLVRTGLLKYLLKLDDYDIDVKITKPDSVILKRKYQSLIYDFETINAPLLEQKRNISIKIIDLITEVINSGMDIDKLQKAETVLLALLVADDPDITWLRKVNFTDNSIQKGLITKLVIEIKKYEEKKAQQKEYSEQTLNQKTVKIESILGIAIDIKTCSVLKYAAYENEAREKIKAQIKANG